MLEIVSQNPSLREVDIYSRLLARKVRDSGYDPDFVFGIAMGGMSPATQVAWHLGKYDVAMLSVRKDGERRIVESNLPLYLHKFSKRNVLLVEDMVYTGKTLQAAKDYLEGYEARVRTACYHTAHQATIEPDYVIVGGLRYEVYFPWDERRQLPLPTTASETFNSDQS